MAARMSAPPIPFDYSGKKGRIRAATEKKKGREESLVVKQRCSGENRRKQRGRGVQQGERRGRDKHRDPAAILQSILKKDGLVDIEITEGGLQKEGRVESNLGQKEKDNEAFSGPEFHKADEPYKPPIPNMPAYAKFFRELNSNKRRYGNNEKVMVEKLIILADFVVLDMKNTSTRDKEQTVLLGKPFMATTKTVIDMHNGKLTMTILGEVDKDDKLEVALTLEKLEENLDEEVLDLHDKLDEAIPILLDESTFEPLDSSIGIKSEIINEPPKVELKKLPNTLKYVFLGEKNMYPVIIASNLSPLKEEATIIELRRLKKATGWGISNIKGISPTMYMHNIILEENSIAVRDTQRRLNLNIKEVVKKEVQKLLDEGIIYPTDDSNWVSPVHVVPKNSSTIVVKNEKRELVSTRMITGWRICIDCRKLNAATKKNHFPLSFIDQILKRLGGHEFYYFLDGLSGYYQVPIVLEDQEKITFTCPFGTFAFRRMPFALCNAPGTFQICMLSIFSDMLEECIEVFMDDFSVFGSSFDTYLSNLTPILERCIECNLTLSWKKSHFMVKQDIVLGHVVSSKGIEVNKAKVDLIAKLPSPTLIKGIISFLGHVGFYRRFIKKISKMTHPLTELLAKDVNFIFNDACLSTFNILKGRLTSAPIIMAPD
eukprot:XP_015574194.1 uncharacterized protein LOC107261200 [Ricinus communis]